MKTDSTDITRQDFFDAINGILDTINRSNHDILDAMNVFATDVEKRFTKIETRLAKVETTLVKVESRVTKVESTMVTKDHLDQKIATLIGRTNRKTEALVEQLVVEKTLSRPGADRILVMPPSLEAL